MTTMLWPTWMDHLKAKSEDMGGQTLAQHTWDVLSRMADQRDLHPHLNLILSERIWAQAFWAALLHDFGKAAAGFQGVLRGEKGPWSEAKHRHEVLSLAFVDWVFPKGHPDRGTVLAMIACHHKDAPMLFDKYGGEVKMGNIKDESVRKSFKKQLKELDKNVSEDVRLDLWHWLDECALSWADALGFVIEPPTLISREEARTLNIDKCIFNALREFHEAYKSTDQLQLTQFLLMRGLILTADHAASAGVDGFPAMPLTRAHAEAPLKEYSLRQHQREAERAEQGSAVLVAPTGSGKTEAALLWAAQQLEARPASRLFYTLPYQASMNAMYKRLACEVLGYEEATVKAGEVETITIRHSRALLKLYQDMMSLDEANAKKASQQAKWLRNKANLNTYPIQIFSPYQMLKAAYSLKGFEALLLDYTDALFIFDEIHAYEPKRLALIIELIRWLREYFGARFFVMTATLPPMLEHKLADALAPQTITATKEEFTRSQRHTVTILEGRLTETIIERVQVDWAEGKAVLVCLNRVADVQRVYVALCNALGLRPDEDIVLLHGRFNGRDRKRKEEILLERARVRREDRRPFICVATQVVEVSLNVDFDTLYSDPAPLEALLQRFGRVNRGRDTNKLLPVHVFTEPSAEANDPYLPYDQTLVESSVRVLTAYCGGKPIDEAQVTTMLGEIYSGETLAAWERDYEESQLTFTRDILGVIKPFTSADKQLKDKFYKLFDGIEVLPVDQLDDYYQARDTRGYLEASQYLVNISYAIYGEFDGYSLICHAKELEDEFVDHIKVTYSSEFGLDIDSVRQAVKAQRDEQLTGDEGE